ncbi:hypothetical protein IG193_05565 [Infirmifilum lucidum]|uniref:OB domain-containing protein n=1 Tax=Infirmifilum lucidum TaxID=2776706 RepID=A0A7L9FEK5_9CREN|nr:hypothetical protein [Infirmifilum lucidum]QOJ78238.1 hypothetical protein IG193_05565 [Infirmifilum lucidum]
MDSNNRELPIDGYLRVLPGEITEENMVREGPLNFLVIKTGRILLKSRRLCTVGTVSSVYSGKHFTDIVLSLDNGQITVRLWESSGLLAQLGEPAENTPLLVLGVLKEYRGQAYISATLMRKVTQEYLAAFKRKLKSDRLILEDMINNNR